MTLTLYHATTIGEANRMAASGFEDRDWDFGLRDARSGEPVSVEGVWLMDRRPEPRDGLDDEALVEVTLDVDEDDLAAFELEGMLWNGKIWVVPAEKLNGHATVRIAEVDPRSSGFFDAVQRDHM